MDDGCSSSHAETDDFCCAGWQAGNASLSRIEAKSNGKHDRKERRAAAKRVRAAKVVVVYNNRE
jgi:hypothetical protein